MSAVETWEHHTAYDYGQFYLTSGPRTLFPDFIHLGREALKPGGIGISEIDNFILVLSPVQCNWTLAVHVERWEQEPAADLESWQQVYEASVSIGADGLIWESVGGEDDPPIPVPAGDYRIRISGRGFVHPYVEDNDTWRLQLWPTTERITPRQLREFVWEPGPPAGGTRAAEN
jgi:hypothetical protein